MSFISRIRTGLNSLQRKVGSAIHTVENKVREKIHYEETHQETRYIADSYVKSVRVGISAGKKAGTKFGERVLTNPILWVGSSAAVGAAIGGPIGAAVFATGGYLLNRYAGYKIGTTAGRYAGEAVGITSAVGASTLFHTGKYANKAAKAIDEHQKRYHIDSLKSSAERAASTGTKIGQEVGDIAATATLGTYGMIAGMIGGSVFGPIGMAIGTVLGTMGGVEAGRIVGKPIGRYVGRGLGYIAGGLRYAVEEGAQKTLEGIGLLGKAGRKFITKMARYVHYHY